MEYFSKGVYTVVPTPLLENESLDINGLYHLIDYYIDAGCHGLLVLGSGGEFPYFSFDERIEIAKRAVQRVKGRVPLLVGAGFTSVQATRDFIQAVGAFSIDGFLVILPTFYPILFSEVYEFFVRLCQESAKPILYYNYPQMTGLHLSAEQISRLLSINGMVGMKDSILNLPEIARHIRLSKGRNAAILSGNSFAIRKILEYGGQGVIDVMASVVPRLVLDCFAACIEKNENRADVLQERICNLVPLLTNFKIVPVLQKQLLKIVSTLPIRLKNKNPSRTAVIKETLRQMGHPLTARVRSPQPQLSAFDKDAIQELIRKNNMTL